MAKRASRPVRSSSSSGGNGPVEVIIVEPQRIKAFQERMKDNVQRKVALDEMDLFGRKAVNAIQNISPAREGKTRNGFDYRVVKSGADIGQLKLTWKAADRPRELLKWLIQGTGIRGPLKRPITPKRAKVLRWRDVRGQWHSARSVRGMKPNDFISKALRNLSQEKQRLIERIGKITVQKMIGKD